MKKTLIDFILRALVICLAGALLVVGCTGTSQSLLKVGTNVWAGYETLYLAREKQFFSDKHIRMVELNSASEVMNAFRNERIDVAALTLDEALTLKSEGLPVKVFLVMDISMGADTLLVRPEIVSFQDLKGKNIGVEQTAVGAIMLEGFLDKSGLALLDLNVMNITADGHVKAYLDNRVDAVITFEPNTTKLTKAGAVRLFDSADIAGRIVDVLVTRESILQSHRATLEELVDGQFRALEMFKEKPAEAAPLMAPRVGLSEKELLESYVGLTLPDRTANRALMSGQSSDLVKTVEELQTIMLRVGLINAAFDASNVIDDSLVGD